jgi:carboxymethylenebutenolidase
VPGPLARDDQRAAPRGQPRLDKIRTGERDLADTLALLRREPLFNGRAAVIGFCYGGPYAILGPKRLGYDAGISCHGTQLLDFIGELEACARRCASSGATRTTPRPLRCSRRTAACPRA